MRKIKTRADGTPVQPRNKKVRPRGEWLRKDEVERLAKAAGKSGRHRFRDEWLIRIAYRHGLRVSELIHLRRDVADLNRMSIHINRLKDSLPSTHYMTDGEVRAFRRLMREYPESPYVFVTERGGALTRSGIQKIVSRAGEKAELTMPVHPHMLRHACGYAMANAGTDMRTIQAWLGHAQIHHTQHYCDLAEGRLLGAFPD